MKHGHINHWYQVENIRFDGMTPRDYLRGKDWGERGRTGLLFTCPPTRNWRAERFGPPRAHSALP
jgi:hypothetical protein